MLVTVGRTTAHHNVIHSFTSARSVSLPIHRSGSLRLSKLFSTSTLRQAPSSTSSRQVQIFLPHEQLTLKSHLKAATTKSASKGRTSLNASHHDLKSYLTLHRQRLSQISDPELRTKHVTSTVHLGTRYEYLIHSHLTSQLSFSLTRVGGKGDGGVDLIGTWTLPEPASLPAAKRSFRVLCQAKRMSPNRGPGPALMRELEGTVMSATGSGARVLAEAFVAHSLRTRGAKSVLEDELAEGASNSEVDEDAVVEKPDLSHLPTMGILITTRPLSDGIEKAMASSRRPLMYMCLEELSVADERYSIPSETGDNLSDVPKVIIRQMAWNKAASRDGLEGYGIAQKYTDEQSGLRDASSGFDSEASLVFQGQPLQFGPIT